jgi:hypothetical protein
MASKWGENYIAVLKGQTTRNDQQELTVLLFDKQDKTPQEAKGLNILLRAEHTKELAKTAALNASKLLTAKKEEEHKARNHRLIQQGALIDLANLQGWDKGELLGGLLALAKGAAESKTNWKQQGDELLAKK